MSATDPSDPTSLPAIFARRSAAPRPQARSLAGPPPHPRPAPATAPEKRHQPREIVTTLGLGTSHETVDYTAVRQIRDSLIERARAAEISLNPDTPGDVVEDLIAREIREWSERRTSVGQGALTHVERDALVRPVQDALFGQGRITPLLELPGLTDIEANGCDDVHLIFADGRIERGPAIADSDEDLVADIQTIARYAPGGEKSFSPVTKYIRMALPDGSRMAAEAWMGGRPTIAIRKHRFVDTDLDEMEQLGAVDTGLAQFLAAAVKAGLSIVIAGFPAAGKTTLTRAILAALHPQVRIATVENAFELHLNKMPHRHHRVWAKEAQEGGELTTAGVRPGQITLTRLVELALQQNTDRLVVGEVVGSEIVDMLQSMQTGKGCVTTMHSHSADDTIRRMSTLLLSAMSNLNGDGAHGIIGAAVDLIVYVDTVDEREIGGRLHRFVSEVLELSLSNDSALADPILRNYIYSPGPDGRAVPTGKLLDPKRMAKLERHGFDRGWLRPEASSWGSPLPLIVRDEEAS